MLLIKLRLSPYIQWRSLRCINFHQLMRLTSCQRVSFYQNYLHVNFHVSATQKLQRTSVLWYLNIFWCIDLFTTLAAIQMSPLLLEERALSSPRGVWFYWNSWCWSAMQRRAFFTLPYNKHITRLIKHAEQCVSRRASATGRFVQIWEKPLCTCWKDDGPHRYTWIDYANCVEVSLSLTRYRCTEVAKETRYLPSLLSRRMTACSLSLSLKAATLNCHNYWCWTIPFWELRLTEFSNDGVQMQMSIMVSCCRSCRLKFTWKCFCWVQKTQTNLCARQKH